MWEFIVDRREQIVYNTLQHANLVIECVLVATLLAFALAVLVTRVPRLERSPTRSRRRADAAVVRPSRSAAAVARHLPGTSVVAVDLLRRAADPAQRRRRSAGRRPHTARVRPRHGHGPGARCCASELPLAWPVILAGVRTSTQMSMGVAAIAAFVLGPGLGGYIYTGLEQIGSANACTPPSSARGRGAPRARSRRPAPAGRPRHDLEGNPCLT